MASRQEGGGRNLFPTFGWSTRSPFSRRGLAFVFFVLCVVCGLSFDNLRVLLARVSGCLFCFSLCLFCAFCKTLVVDPGVSGTVVGFLVHLWSCVLLVLRLALSVLFFRGVAACCFCFCPLLALLG